MNEEEKKKALAEIEEKRKELDTLKVKLEELNTEKEACFEKKRQATRAVSEVVKTIRDAKGKRNTFTKQVKDSKQRRQELNKQLAEKRAELSRLQAEKQAISSRMGMRVDPSKIQQEIEQLELKIETEALPFNIEKRVMKRISDKKKILAQAQEGSDVFDRFNTLRKEIDRVKKKADDTHRKVQTKAEASQQFHEELIESSKDIKELRDKEEEMLKKFIESKEKWSAQNDLVRAKVREINEIRAKVEGINIEEKKKQKKADEKKIVEQKKSVEEKIKKGLKLTTDDLLAFQAKEMSSGKGGAGKQKKKQDKPKQKKEEKKEEVKEEPKPEPAPEPEASAEDKPKEEEKKEE